MSVLNAKDTVDTGVFYDKISIDNKTKAIISSDIPSKSADTISCKLENNPKPIILALSKTLLRQAIYLCLHFLARYLVKMTLTLQDETIKKTIMKRLTKNAMLVATAKKCQYPSTAKISFEY